MGSQRMFVCAPRPEDSLPLSTVLGVGFGIVTVECDGEVFWTGDSWTKRLRSVEVQARREPDRRWTVEFYGPMVGTTYERRGRDTWVLIATNEGFA